MLEYIVTVDSNGTKRWRLNGKLHREDGPAIEWSNGSGKRHREDGPAFEGSNGTKLWYLNGELLIEGEYKAKTNPTVEMTVEEICKALGKNVKVVK